MITSEQRKEICRRAGLARAKQFDSEYQKRARANVKRESLQAGGRKRWAQLVARFGVDHALDHLADWRRKHPNALEQLVIQWLDARSVAYLREARVAGIYVDFLLHDGNTVIEVDGKGWHQNGVIDDKDRQGRDAIHTMALTANGYHIIRLPEKSIRDGSAWTTLEVELFAPPATPCALPDDDDAVFEAAIAAEAWHGAVVFPEA